MHNMCWIHSKNNFQRQIGNVLCKRNPNWYIDIVQITPFFATANSEREVYGENNWLSRYATVKLNRALFGNHTRLRTTDETHILPPVCARISCQPTTHVSITVTILTSAKGKPHSNVNFLFFLFAWNSNHTFVVFFCFLVGYSRFIITSFNNKQIQWI